MGGDFRGHLEETEGDDRWFARRLLEAPTCERPRQAHVFPNYLLYYSELFSTFIALEPLAPASTRHVLLGFVPRQIRGHVLDRALQRLFAWAMAWRIRNVLREDMALWPDIQRGLESSHHAGLLSRREERVFAFQQYVETCRGGSARVGGAP